MWSFILWIVVAGTAVPFESPTYINAETCAKYHRAVETALGDNLKFKLDPCLMKR